MPAMAIGLLSQLRLSLNKTDVRRLNQTDVRRIGSAVSTLKRRIRGSLA